MKTKIFIAAAALLTMASLANAQVRNTGQQTNPSPDRQTVTINDNVSGNSNTGVNNFYGRGRGFGPGYGRGYCRGNGAGWGNRQGLPPGQGRGMGPGQGRGLGPGRGQGLAPGGRFYVDTNKNGVCDNFEETVKK